MKIAAKLLMLIWLVGLVPLLLFAFLAHKQFNQTIEHELLVRLDTVAQERIIEISNYLNERMKAVTIIASIPVIADSLVELGNAFKQPEPRSSEYFTREAELGRFADLTRKEFGFYDLLLVDPAGNVVYSLRHEKNLGTNLVSGPYQHTELAQLSARAITRHETVLSAFRYYEPTNKPAAFIAAPVFDGADLLGVIVLQINSEELYGLAKNYTGLGETGETVIAMLEDNSAVLVAPLRHDPAAAFTWKIPLDSREALPIRQAVQGIEGHGSSLDYRGQEIFASWKYLPLVQWGVVVKMDKREALASAITLRNGILLLGLILLALFSVVALLVSHTLSRPIIALTQATRKMSSGDLQARAKVDSRDEIEMLANSFNDMADSLQASQHKMAQAMEKAEAASQAKSTFLANMSHEIRTPLNAIVGFTYLMQQEQPTLQQAERLNKISISSEYLLSILNNILDLSKIEAKKVTLEQSDFHLNAIFDHIQSLFGEQISSKGLVIDVDLNEVPVWLRGDLTHLRQALINYVSNAVKFTQEGRISLRARKLADDGDTVLVRFEVKDTGIGIDPVKLRGLFVAFEQADTSTTRIYGGTGLGLVITRRLAELMGGEAGATSEPGKGSTFWFTARLGRSHGVMPSAPLAEITVVEMEPPPRQHVSRILLVEDNAINREVAIVLLASARLMVDTVENGREAVEKVRTADYDLILMDVHMPEMDGLEAARMIRAMAGKADIPILAMTGAVYQGDRQACLEAGMNDFISKPINRQDMLSTIFKWLQQQANIETND